MATDPPSVVVPLTQLSTLLHGLREHDGEKRELLEKLEERRHRVQTLKQKTEQVELKLAQYKSDHRQSMLLPPRSPARFKDGATSVQLPYLSFSSASPHHSSSPSATIKRPLPPNAATSTATLFATNATKLNALIPAEPAAGVGSQNNNDLRGTPSPSARTGRVLLMRERISQLEDVVASVKEISAQGDFADVMARALGAAQKLVRADKYTLGLLNERRNIVEIFSVVPQQRPHPQPPVRRGMKHAALPFVSEGFVAADSTTTFARVIMTGKPLDIEDFDTHENYDQQIKSGGIVPRALFCLPIRNAHRAIVGIFQVLNMNESHTSAARAHERASASGSMDVATDLAASTAALSSPPRAAPTASRAFTDADKRSLEFLTVVAGSAIWNLILVRERQTAQNRIEGLLKLHRNISMEAVSSTVLDQVLSVCHELLGTERIGLFMKIDGEDELYIACAADIVRGEYVPITKGIVGYVARTGETVITNDAYAHPVFDPTLDQKTGFVTRRILCLPVRSPEGAILAVLSAVNKVDNTDFTGEDAVFLNYAADAVGISLHKASLHHEVKTSQKLIEARLRLTTFVSESANIEEFVDLVMEIGKDIMECDRFGLLLIDHFKKELWITPRVGGESIRTPMNRGISGLVASTGRTVCTRDAYKHELFDPSVDVRTGYRTTSVLCAPIFEDHAVSSPKCVAVAMCINKMEGSHVVAFTQTDRAVMDKYTREVQFALGRLSLDISYYKVVSDCSAVAGDGGSSTATLSGSGGSRRSSSTMRLDHYSETDIISSIVHKYCNSGPKAGAGDDSSGGPGGGNGVSGAPDGSHASMSLLAVVPAMLRKKLEDDDVPFPRAIAFARGPDELLEQWDMDALALSSSDVGALTGAAFRAYGFLEAFRIAGDKFAAFTTNVANYYRTNPFHNLQHAFQVLLAVHTMIRAECRKFFSGVEIFAMLVAALCHDIDHPGNSNDLELRTLSPLALTHNDDAVLERHHCRVTFIILNHKSAKILQHLDEARARRVRQLIIYCILATDMGKHFEKCKALEALSRRQLSEKRQLLMGILVHAADLSFHTLPFRQAVEWGARLLDEFQNQARVEAEQGVATDFFMQGLESRKTRLVVQLNYINYVVRPIWLPLTSLCHHLRFYTDSLELNFDLYRQQLDEEEAETPSQPKDAAPASTPAAASSTTGPPFVSSVAPVHFSCPHHVGAPNE
ncbi:hypothetical protein PybrP1_006225 [[Pythium] brassicae (nom. inval.)]|nr:hypothetical protein PybrP1_006225 [[Pythium] brassicae (nom. inval.)]